LNGDEAETFNDLKHAPGQFEGLAGMLGLEE
jgi:hypothetical protein